MKLRKFGLLFAIPLLVAGTGCEEGAEGEEAAADEAAAGEAAPAGEEAAPAGEEGAAAGEGAEEAAAAAPGPGDTCQKLIEAIGAKNVEQVQAMSGDGADKITAASIEGISATLADASCGDAAVEGDRATVPVTAGDQTREIVFVKAGEDWKFDVGAYMTKYPPPSNGKGKKKEKAAKGKKGKRKGKKKG